MPNVFECQCPACSRGLRAREADRGKWFKCPGCDSHFHLGEEEARADEPAQIARVQKQPARIRPQGKQRQCPSCHQPLAADAVVCIECGLNLETGRRLRTIHQHIRPDDPPPRRSRGGIHISRAVVLGVLMITGAVVLLVVGRAFGLFYCAVPFLMIFGALAILRGLQGDRD
jgi:hypothetical protein